MLGQILELLWEDDWHGISKNVEIAKGKNEIVDDWKTFKSHLKRMYHGRKI